MLEEPRSSATRRQRSEEVAGTGRDARQYKLLQRVARSGRGGLSSRPNASAMGGFVGRSARGRRRWPTAGAAAWAAMTRLLDLVIQEPTTARALFVEVHACRGALPAYYEALDRFAAALDRQGREEASAESSSHRRRRERSSSADSSRSSASRRCETPARTSGGCSRADALRRPPTSGPRPPRRSWPARRWRRAARGARKAATTGTGCAESPVRFAEPNGRMQAGRRADRPSPGEGRADVEAGA